MEYKPQNIKVVLRVKTLASISMYNLKRDWEIFVGSLT